MKWIISFLAWPYGRGILLLKFYHPCLYRLPRTEIELSSMNDRPLFKDRLLTSNAVSAAMSPPEFLTSSWAMNSPSERVPSPFSSSLSNKPAQLPPKISSRISKIVFQISSQFSISQQKGVDYLKTNLMVELPSRTLLYWFHHPC